MVAAGAVIELRQTGKILLVKRSSDLDWHPNQWEIGYGRIAQFESAEEGLRREVFEELQVKDLEIIKVLRVWHIYRGSKKPENDLIGITYHCRTNQEQITLSNEHQNYAWVTPAEALNRITIDGIRADVDAFIREQ